MNVGEPCYVDEPCIGRPLTLVLLRGDFTSPISPFHRTPCARSPAHGEDARRLPPMLVPLRDCRWSAQRRHVVMEETASRGNGHGSCGVTGRWLECHDWAMLERGGHWAMHGWGGVTGPWLGWRHWAMAGAGSLGHGWGGVTGLWLGRRHWAMAGAASLGHGRGGVTGPWLGPGRGRPSGPLLAAAAPSARGPGGEGEGGEREEREDKGGDHSVGAAGQRRGKSAPTARHQGRGRGQGYRGGRGPRAGRRRRRRRPFRQARHLRV